MNKPTPLIILGSTVGAGTHSAEMVDIVTRINNERPTWELLGYIVDNDAEQQDDSYPVLGGPEAIAQYPDAMFVAMNGRPPAPAVPRERMAILIDPSCSVSRTAHLSAGTVLYPHCFVGLNARIGRDVFVLAGCVINHDVHLADRVIVASSATLAGNVHVGAGSYLGQSCSIRQNIHIGSNCTIGMGAVVLNDVPDDTVVVGNPARPLCQRKKSGD